jgi:hypothetical protein
MEGQITMTDDITMDTQNEQPAGEPTSEPDAPVDDDGIPAVDLGQVRELIIAAYPDVVPEMIGGDSFDALMTSIEPARDAYQRIASKTARPDAPRVAAQPNQRSTMTADMETLSPLGKISEGLRRQSA